MPRVTRSLQPYFKHDGSKAMTGNLDLDIYKLLFEDIILKQVSVNEMFLTDRATETAAKDWILRNMLIYSSITGLGTTLHFYPRAIDNSSWVFYARDNDTDLMVECAKLLSASEPEFGISRLGDLTFLAGKGFLSDVLITDDKFLEFLNTSDGQRSRVMFTDGYPFDFYVRNLAGAALRNPFWYDYARDYFDFNCNIQLFEDFYLSDNKIVDFAGNPILYTPLKHICPFVLDVGVTDVFIETIPSGLLTQDLHVDKIGVALDQPVGDGKTVTVNVSDGTNTMTVTITGAVAKTGSTETNNFDLDVSAESLTLEYSQDAGGAATRGSITCLFHLITNV